MNIEHLVKKIQLLTWEERANETIAPQKLPPKRIKIEDIKTEENLEWLNQLKVNPIQKLMDSKNSLVHYKLVNFIFRLLPADPLYKRSLEDLKNDFHRVGNLKTLDAINYEISNIPDNKMSIYQLITLIKTLSELYDYFCHNRMNTIKNHSIIFLNNKKVMVVSPIIFI